MSLTKNSIPVSRYEYFEYYASGGTATETISESLTPSQAFELDSIKFHLSVAHASVVDFCVWVSSVLGSAYNLNLLSQAMNGVKDLFWGPDRTMILNTNDCINISMVNSTGTVWGLVVNGWSVTA